MSLSTQPLNSIDWGTYVFGSTISYAFGDAGTQTTFSEEYGLGDSFTAEGFNAYEEGQFRAAFDLLETVIDVTFTETASYSSADFRLLGDANQFFFGDLGAMVPPWEIGEGIGVFNTSAWDRTAGGTLDLGGDGFTTIVHEVMHGLGLAHPHDTGGGNSAIMTGVTSAFDDYGTYDLNQGVFTGMSYNTGLWTGTVGALTTTAGYGYEIGPMALDIAALQEKYGANTTHASGADVYVLPDANAGGTGWISIWDTGGADVIRYQGGSDAVIDLRAASLANDFGGGGYLSAANGIQGGFSIAAGVQIERADGGSGNDLLTGNAFDNVLSGAGGIDTLNGGDGADKLYGGAGADDLRGGLGTDVLKGAAGADSLRGHDGGDTMDGGADSDTLIGDEGNDYLIGGDGDDRLYGGVGADKLFGGNGNDTLKGNSENGVFYGNAGADRIEGGSLNDWMKGGTEGDMLFGFAGNDTLFGEAGADSLYSGAGDDRLLGGSGDDLIRNTSGFGQLFGNLGDDRLEGGSDADFIAGGNNDDTITGGGGNDTLKGEGGADTFIFGIGFDQDRLRDLGGPDRLRIDDALLTGQTTGAAVVSAFGTVFATRTELDFGGGDVLILDGVMDTGYLAGVIDIF